MRVRRTLVCVALLGWGLLVGGCGSALPAYEWTGHQQAMLDLVERGRAVRSVSGECTIHMQHADGGGVSLDGALAARNPHHLRLRAWKFNHVAFDLTMNPDGLWLLTGDGGQDEPPHVTISQVAGAWSLLSGEYFQQAHVVATRGREQIVVGPNAEETRVRCIIDRRTLVPLRFEYLDAQDRVGASLELQRHRMINGHIWPMRMTFTSSHGSVVITMRNVEINSELPDAAFHPPRRAVRQP